MPSDLPASPSFVTQLFKSLPTPPQKSGPDTISEPSSGAPSAGQGHGSTNYNPLTAAPEAVRKTLLTLHVLFPNEFLPALDLLDRRLVTRFRIVRGSDAEVRDEAQPKGIYPSAVAGRRGADGLIIDAADARTAPSARTEAQNVVGIDPASPFSAVTSTSAATITAGAIDTPRADLEMTDADPGPSVPNQQESGVTGGTHLENHTGAGAGGSYDTIYYVRSAQQRSSRFSTSYDSTTNYEVRLQAWNCSCPAFAFSSFPSTHHEPSILSVGLADLDQVNFGPVHDEHASSEHDSWRFGGVSLGDAMPGVCKHILACTLVEHCAMFSTFVEEKDVSGEEAAAWAAGWGD